METRILNCRNSTALGVVLLLILCGCNNPDPKIPQDETGDAGERGIAFLLQQQSEDGLWRSPNYGNLKEGAAMTAFVLYSFQDHPFDDKSKLQAAVDALLPEIREHGYVTNPNGPDYTNYGSAMLLVACERLGLTLPEDVETQLVDYLVRSQLDFEEGFQPKYVDFGGWDLTGWMTGDRPTTGTNISVTASVLEALALFKDRRSVADAMEESESWAYRVQNRDGDGGFYFHPQRNHDGNKAGWSDGNDRGQTRSYGSATADGLQILVALGKTTEDDEVKAAVRWLVQNDELKTVPGFEHESGEGSWAIGLRYYYYQSISRSLSLLPEKDAARIAKSISEILIADQKADGSWSNPNARMREDDPLIATGFAVIALRNCRKYLDRP